MNVTTKDTNPKDAIAQAKVPLHLLSPIAKAFWALAQFAGMCKYGGWNWRITGVRASVYLSAMERHMDAYKSGEDLDPSDRTHHLGNVMACAAILLDAREAGKLVDDRPPVVGLRSCYASQEYLSTVLAEQYKDRAPHHRTIADVVIPIQAHPPAYLTRTVIHTETPDPEATSETIPSAPGPRHMTSVPVTSTDPDGDPPPSYQAEPDPFPHQSDAPSTLKSSGQGTEYVRHEHIGDYRIWHLRDGRLEGEADAEDAVEAWAKKTAFEGFAQKGDRVYVSKRGHMVYNHEVR